jgi:Na+-transporting NADH:ubiquinone oxidoreductase subunit B/electron transport complex protein RnfD
MQNQAHRHLDHILNNKNMYILTAFLVTLLIISAFIYSFYVVILGLVSVVVAGLVEYVFSYFRKKPFEKTGIMVTPLILTLLMPPLLPIYMIAIGSFFSVFFGKMIFGGLGRNLFNPAIVGYLFLIITFPVELTTQYIVPGTDLFTSATLLRDRSFGFSITNVTDVLLGEYAGTIGNTFKLGVIILGLGLIILKISDWRIPLSIVVSMVVFTFIFDAIYPENFHQGLMSIFVGGALFAAFFVATDPVSAPFTQRGKIIYGVGIAFITVIIRGLAAFPEGFIFAIIIMNSIAPMIDSMKWVQPKEVTA